MDKKIKIRNDYNSVIRQYKFLDSAELQLLANSANEDYLIVYVNAIINCHKVGFCDFPWNYFDNIGIRNIKELLAKFILNNPEFEFHEYFNTGIPGIKGDCRSVSITNKQAIEEKYKAITKCRRENMSQKTKTLYKQTYQNISDKQDIKYTTLPTIKYLSYLNNVTIPACVSARIITAINLNMFSDIDNHRLIDVHQKIRSGYKYLIDEDKSNVNLRFGGLFNNLSRDIRRFILNKDDGFLELDLKAAHLSFLCAKTNLILPDDVIQIIANETGLLKERVKECVVTTIYGGKSSPMDALITDKDRRADHVWGRTNEAAKSNEEQETADYAKMMANAHYKAIRGAVKEFSEQIAKDNGVTDVFGRFIQQTTSHGIVAGKLDVKTIMAAYYSAIEKKLIMKLLPLTNKGFRVISDEHDGCTVYISNPTRKEEIIKLCKNAVQKEAKRLGINTTLETK